MTRPVELLLPADVLASAPRRRIATTVVPYGQVADLLRGGRLCFAGPPDNLDATLDLVLDHDDDAVVGRSVTVASTPAGLDAAFTVYRHPTGDDVLAAAADGRRNGVSVRATVLEEHTDPAGHQVVTRWRARHVALVETPAFGTRVRDVAAAAREAVTMTEPALDPVDDPTVDPDQTTIDDPAEPEPDTEPAEPAQQRTALASIGAPGRVPARPPARTATPVRRRGLDDLTRVTAAAARRDGSAGRDVMAALADITYSANPWAIPPQYAGELWSGIPYQRQIVPLMTPGVLTSPKVTGWRWSVRPEVDDWTGDKTDVPSNPAATDDDTVSAQFLAGAHDIDRVLRDFGNDEFWRSYYAAMAMDYAIKSDARAATRLLAGATTRPAGASFTAALVDALLFVGEQAPATFALVSADILVELLSMDGINMPAILSGVLGGNVENPLGNLTIRSHRSIPANTIVVGTRPAVTFYELPGSPIRVETVNVPQGGIDAAVFGYFATFINNPLGLVKTSVTPTPPAAAHTGGSGS